MKAKTKILILLLSVMFSWSISAQSQSIKKYPQIKYVSLETEVNSMPSNYNNVVNELDESHKLELEDYKELMDLYTERDYTPEVWKAGIREIPRLYITDMGDWGTKGSKELNVLNKKRIFFRAVTPMILHANELIMLDRERLTNNITAFELNNSFNEKEEAWLKNLAETYKVKLVDDRFSMETLEEIHQRVDIIPASLALAQAAAESGWGTSRFADKGNAMFGQWSWGSDAMVPEEQREHLGDYGVAAYGSIQESISSYMLNLNSHYAYASLRKRRAQLRKKKEKVTGYVLAEELLHYSERGESYVKTLQSIMDYNQLRPTDDAYLKNEKPLYLFPPEN